MGGLIVGGDASSPALRAPPRRMPLRSPGDEELTTVIITLKVQHEALLNDSQ